jgi:uncharacterized protein (DUF1684 family)
MKTLIASLAFAVAVFSAACGGAPKTPASKAADAAKPRTPPAEAPADPYHAEIAQFQKEREDALTAENGWLTIGGLWFLSQPDTTFGSDPLNDIVLPAGAPARAGTFMVRNGKVRVEAANGVRFQLDGKPVTSADLKADGEGTPDRLGLGDLQLWVHNSGDRLSIRMRDKNNPLRKTFVGTSWFPVNAAFRIEGTYTPYKTPKVVEVPNILGDIDRMPIPGIVTFSLNGREHKLEPVAEAGDQQLWFIFRDLTSQNETYPAARFLYTEAPKDGKVILDFNRAVNPPCAYNPYTTCPLPTEQNRLRTRIEAGEMKYKGHV